MRKFLHMAGGIAKKTLATAAKLAKKLAHIVLQAAGAAVSAVGKAVKGLLGKAACGVGKKVQKFIPPVCKVVMIVSGAVALLSCAALGKNPPFFGEFTVRHPEDKNVELLWHCGPFAYSLKKPGTVAREENQRQWIQVKDGKFTICRFDQDDGHYQLLNGTLESADGPYTFGTYLWARCNNLTKWERKLIDGPYIHHLAEVEGDYTWELREFCRLIPHLDSDTVD